VYLCSVCREYALCADCATAIEKELQVCGNEDCALKAIARLRGDAYKRGCRLRGLPTIPEVPLCNDSPIYGEKDEAA
jgi:hypothetical protein